MKNISIKSTTSLRALTWLLATCSILWSCGGSERALYETYFEGSEQDKPTVFSYEIAELLDAESVSHGGLLTFERFVCERESARDAGGVLRRRVVSCRSQGDVTAYDSSGFVPLWAVQSSAYTHAYLGDDYSGGELVTTLKHGPTGAVVICTGALSRPAQGAEDVSHACEPAQASDASAPFLVFSVRDDVPSLP